MYRLIITKTAPNENYAVELAAHEERKKDRGYGYREDREMAPQEIITTDALICQLTEEQFKALKAGALKVFE